MSMVEKVARAILNAHAGDIPVHDADLQWSWWIEEARAAIEAMKEPTEGMKKALQDNIWPDRDGDIDRDQFGPAFTAAINAALSEGEG